ncbi:MAG: Purine nucleoside phosphorylase [uncultured Campylobacterales bacterium]|uniref:Purine nucleoside phosphorylase n=1 Tax=uncultured Campylobacterales bacterium TaxID=352960 RepID=A0A6S6SY56_9BACT|nr:MAG: Purine nucleoside phosphorylase [uncultured Campylobacterales bacterium]
MFISAGNNEIFDFASPIGVGMNESTINLTRLALMDKPEYLIYIGSAGSYGNYKIFDVVESYTGSNIELSFLQNNSYTPIENVISSKDSETNIVNSSNYITTNSEISKKYLRFNIELENMEFFSVMRVAQEFDIPVKGIFVVTNYCNSNAHEDFVKNHEQAKKILIQYIKTLSIK